jgi:hypothetical protein
VLTVLNGGKPPKKEPSAKKPDKGAVKKGGSKGEEDPALPPADVSLTSGLDAVLVLNSSSSASTGSSAASSAGTEAVSAELRTFWSGFAGGALSAAVQLEVAAGESPVVPTAVPTVATDATTATAATATAADGSQTGNLATDAAAASVSVAITSEETAAAKATAVEARLTETLYLLMEAAAERRAVTAASVTTAAGADVSSDAATSANSDTAAAVVGESATAVSSSSVVLLTDGLDKRRTARRQVQLIQTTLYIYIYRPLECMCTNVPRVCSADRNIRLPRLPTCFAAEPLYDTCVHNAMPVCWLSL